jgi:protein-tyrosine phosphatase
VGYLRLPVQHGDHEPTAVFERIRSGDYGWISERFMLDGYIEGLDRHAHVWASYLRALAEARNRPLLFHCTGGKDRTGAAAALTLLALGVPEETVVADFGLSDGCNAEVRRRVYDLLRPLGVDIPTVEPYFTAPPDRLRALLDHLQRTYGTVEDYLVRTAGVEPDVMSRLKDELLE